MKIHILTREHAAPTFISAHTLLKLQITLSYHTCTFHVVSLILISHIIGSYGVA